MNEYLIYAQVLKDFRVKAKSCEDAIKQVKLAFDGYDVEVIWTQKVKEND